MIPRAEDATGALLDVSPDELQPALELAEVAVGLPADLAAHVEVTRELVKLRAAAASRNIKQASVLGHAMTSRYGVCAPRCSIRVDDGVVAVLRTVVQL